MRTRSLRKIGVAAGWRVQIGAQLVTRYARGRFDLRDPFSGDAPLALIQPISDEGLARADGLSQAGLRLQLGLADGFRQDWMLGRRHAV